MGRIGLKAQDKNQQLVLAYLEENASDELVEKINAGKKTMTGCWDFITARAKARASGRCACIEDVEVYGWAVHYFEEADEDLKKESDAEKSFLQKARDEAARKREIERKKAEAEAAEKAARERERQERERKEREAKKAAELEEKRKKAEEKKAGAVAGQFSMFDLLGEG
ncbi:MAG: hypothetical protein IK035_07715 [Firmicutes bacterium]|nr:hypothetical protein [Bacillota bacterium]